MMSTRKIKSDIDAAFSRPLRPVFNRSVPRVHENEAILRGICG